MANYERTEDDVIAQAPIKVSFGGKEYSIKLLTILKQRKWREQLVEEIEKVSGEFAPECQTAQHFFAGLKFTMLKFPEKLADLIFSYDPSLPREEIEAVATEEEILRAFSRLMVVAFPFLPQLAMMNSFLKAGAKLSQ